MPDHVDILGSERSGYHALKYRAGPESMLAYLRALESAYMSGGVSRSWGASSFDGRPSLAPVDSWEFRLGCLISDSLV